MLEWNALPLWVAHFFCVKSPVIHPKMLTFAIIMKKRIKIGLLGRIIIAMALGVGIGYVSPMWLAQTFATFSAIFSQFLGFLIPLIIVGFVSPAIADLGNRAGKMLIVTALIAYLATILAGYGSYLTSDLLFPDILKNQIMPLEAEEAAAGIEPFFTIAMPPLMGVTSALVLAFMLGLGCAYITGKVLRDCINDFRDIVAKAITGVVIPLLPIYICSIFVTMTVEGKVATILTAFSKIILIIFAMHIILLLLQYCVAALFYRRNPLKMLWTMMPAYFTALGTQSSAATIPITLRQTMVMGVGRDIAGFVVPLCATIHMSGSTLKIVSCAVALMVLQGIHYDIGAMTEFITMLGITIIAAPGIPGGAIMASLGLLSGVLGFTEAQNAMMIALYIAMDSFGTACNVTGDGAIAAIIDRIFAKKDKKFGIR